MKRTHFLIATAIAGLVAVLVLPHLAGSSTRRQTSQEDKSDPQLVESSPNRGAAPLNFGARPARHRILAAGDDLDVVYEISAPAAADQERLPVDFALVFDRSGSMWGEPLTKAKAAAVSLVDKLLPMDRLAVIDFGSESHLDLVMTPMDEGGKARARDVISRISADGGTNTSSALQLAETTLLNAGARERAVRRVVLLSDGKANEGIVGPGLVELAGELGRQRMRVSALGLGVDFDATMMTSIADAGGGQYRYLRDADEVSAALSQELAQAAWTAASNLVLTLRPRDGVTIGEVVGYESTSIDGNKKIALSDVADGEIRRVVVRVHVGSGSSGDRAVLSSNLTGEDVRYDHRQFSRGQAVDVEATTDSGLVAASVDRDAARTGLRARLGGTILGALRSYDQRDIAGASSSLSQGVAALKAEAAMIGDVNLQAELDTKGGEAAGMIHAAPSPAAYANQKSLHSFGLAASR